VVNMVVGESSHKMVAVVVVWLESEVDAVRLTNLLGCLDKVLWQKLLLLVEVVTGTLSYVSYLSSYRIPQISLPRQSECREDRPSTA